MQTLLTPTRRTPTRPRQPAPPTLTRRQTKATRKPVQPAQTTASTAQTTEQELDVRQLASTVLATRASEPSDTLRASQASTKATDAFHRPRPTRKPHNATSAPLTGGLAQPRTRPISAPLDAREAIQAPPTTALLNTTSLLRKKYSTCSVDAAIVAPRKEPTRPARIVRITTTAHLTAAPRTATWTGLPKQRTTKMPLSSGKTRGTLTPPVRAKTTNTRSRLSPKTALACPR